jgi:ABC-type bacteriocin/lantibiotic exporter with double-glycine peptidase domain
MNYIKFIFSFVSKKNFLIIIILFLSSTLLEYLFVLSVPLLIKVSTTGEVGSYLKISLFNLNDKKDLLFYSFFIIFFLFLLKNLLYLLSQYFFLNFSYKVQNNLSTYLFKKYLSYKYSLFLSFKSSTLIRNVFENCETISRAFIVNSINFFCEIFIILGLIFIVITQSNLSSIYLILLIFLFTFIYLFFSRSFAITWGSSKINLDNQKLKFLQEGLSSFKELKVFDKGEYYLKNFYRMTSKSNQLNIKFGILQLIPRFYLEVMGAFTIIILIFLNLEKNGSKNFLNLLPMLSLYFVVIMRILPSINRIVNSLESFRFSFPLLKSIYRDLNYDVSQKKFPNKKFLIKFKSKITFKNVSFSFSKKEKIFEKLNFVIKRGEKIGLIGESGIGKTTFLNLISGLLHPTSGNIYCDNRLIEEDPKDWYPNIAYIYQSNFILNDTIENNISFNSLKNGEHYKKIKMIINLLNLGNFLKKQSAGLNTYIGDGGAKLSGGQIQKIAIARAIYSDREIFICDEITSSLDGSSEKVILNILNKLNKTIIMISHKAENLYFCNKIYQVKNKNIFTVKNKKYLILKKN